MSFYPYKHIEPEIKTIGALINRVDERVFLNLTSKELLDVTYENKTNYERLLEKIEATDVTLGKVIDAAFLYDTGDYDNIELVPDVTFFIPDQKLNIETLYKADQNVITMSEFGAFLAKSRQRLLRDVNYAQLVNEDPNGSIIIENRDATVYVYARALKQWIDISPYIFSLTTSVGENGGQFNIDIAPFETFFVSNQEEGEDAGIWEEISGILGIKKDGQEGIAYDAYKVSHINEEVLDSAGAGLKRKNYFAHTVFQQNDLFYIKFESLRSDTSAKPEDFKLSPNDVRGDWDMIGLLDESNLTIDSATNNIQISLSGRDLIKSFIDDECVFFPEEFAAPIFATGADDPTKLLKRLFGKYLTFNSYILTSLQFNLQFIMNQLSNTGFVDNDAFSGYPDNDVTKINRRIFSELYDKTNLSENQFNPDKYQEKVGLEKADGVWRIINLIIDDASRERRIVDNSIFSEQGSLINFVRKICQPEFVEFLPDTYGDKYFLQIRKPPWDFNGMKGLVYDLNVADESSLSSNNITKQNTPEPIPVTDAFFKKLNKTFSSSDPDEDVADQEAIRADSLISPMVISISDAFVLNENLSYETQAYSWYSLLPRGVLNGQEQEMAWAYLRAVYFDRYVEVFGSKPLRVTSNYSKFIPLVDGKFNTKSNEFTKQALQDLKFLVESNAYLPFTRRGVITIHGDRRIKRGQFIHYLPTNEIFYVDSVQNNRRISTSTIDRTTTLNVSRGMVEPYINGVPVFGETISYFNLVKTEIDQDVTYGSANQILNKWETNDAVFDFFLNRRQWTKVTESAF